MSNSVDYSSVNALPQVWQQAAASFADTVGLYDPHSKPEVKLTYRELYEKLQQFAAGLQALGLTEGDKIALFADNSPRWFIADQGTIMAGAANAVRSAQADSEELLYILENSDSTSLIVENLQTLAKLQPRVGDLPLKFVILLANETPDGDYPWQILNFQQVMELGATHTLQPPNPTQETLATLIYTSGTTGKPKGVMLSHGNLLHQIINLDTIIQPLPGDRALSILPSWHSYERSCEYFLFSRGATLFYSSIRTFKNDIKNIKPHYLVGVPRLWESIYEGIQKQLSTQPPNTQKIAKFFLNISEKYILARRIANNLSLEHLNASSLTRFRAKLQTGLLTPLHALGDKLVYSKIRQGTGGKLKSLISGGGALPRFLEDFFEIVNIPILVGYGLTETSPVTNARTPNHNLRYSSGKPLPGTEIAIVDPDTKELVRRGSKGLVLIRGPQIMQGYYKNPEATAKAIDQEGWFDSGDLGWVTPQNDLVLTGRAKDTIVLSNGENIEPQPIEDACVRSPYINQIMLVGQDQKSLGALIVPNLETLQKWSEENALGLTFSEDSASQEEIQTQTLLSQPVLKLFRGELNREVKNRPGYRPDDQIKAFDFILEPFSQENGMMTQTLKIKRPVVTERYRAIIDKMFQD